MFVMGDACSNVTNSLSMMDSWISMDGSPMVPLLFDSMWFNADKIMWEAARDQGNLVEWLKSSV
jgi:hypothetical protein